MHRPTRRSFLGAGIGAGAWLAITPRPKPGAVARPPRRRRADLDELAQWVRDTPRDALLDAAAALHRAGTHWRDLLAAAFLAGIREVEPRPVGFQFHCVMMTHSAFRIAQGAPAGDRLAAALFNLDDFKQSQARDRERGRGPDKGDWRLGPPPTLREGELDATRAGAALRAAMQAWDRAAADRAAVALARTATLDEAFEPLWWFAMRDFTNIGHNPIFAAQAHRTLQEIGWRHGEEVLRSLVMGLLDGAPGTGDDSFVANLDRSAAAPDERPGRDSALASRDVLVAMRTATADAASATAAACLTDGLSLTSLHDGLRLIAIEQMWRAPGLLPAHALTSLDALRYIGQRARDARTRAMATLQAAAWQVQYRDFLSARASYDPSGKGIDAVAGAADPVTVAAAFAGAKGAPEHALAAGMRAAGDDPRGFAHSIRHWLLRKVREHHDYKFAAALLDEAAASPGHAATLYGASLGYLRGPDDPDHPLWQRMQG